MLNQCRIYKQQNNNITSEEQEIVDFSQEEVEEEEDLSQDEVEEEVDLSQNNDEPHVAEIEA